MKLREIVYMVMDELKLLSDDSSFNEDHIKFLVDKYRSNFLNQNYVKGGVVSESNYQNINLSLVPIIDTSIYGIEKEYKKSTDTISSIMSISNTKANIVITQTIETEIENENGELETIETEVKTDSYFNYKFVYVPKDRLDFVGFNKWLKNIVYWTIKDNYVYVYSNNEDISFINEINIRAVFESTLVDLDDEYPLESGLVPLVIQSIVQELSPKIVQPEDSYNNASDDKANINNYIARNIKQND